MTTLEGVVLCLVVWNIYLTIRVEVHSKAIGRLIDLADKQNATCADLVKIQGTFTNVLAALEQRTRNLY